MDKFAANLGIFPLLPAIIVWGASFSFNRAAIAA